MPKSSTSWKPNQSGNPNGRPRLGESFAEVLRAAMTTEQREAIANKVISMAAQGDIRAMVFIADRLDGKPAQRQIVAGDEGQPLIIRYIDPREPSDT